ncbi:MAG: hypothetical protein KJ757_07865 [Planctomycetes bacterium]|nr:hypothetical protein [Planctomycetota bacterium]
MEHIRRFIDLLKEEPDRNQLCEKIAAQVQEKAEIGSVFRSTHSRVRVTINIIKGWDENRPEFTIYITRPLSDGSFIDVDGLRLEKFDDGNWFVDDAGLMTKHLRGIKRLSHALKCIKNVTLDENH